MCVRILLAGIRYYTSLILIPRVCTLVQTITGTMVTNKVTCKVVIEPLLKISHFSIPCSLLYILWKFCLLITIHSQDILLLHHVSTFFYHLSLRFQFFENFRFSNNFSKACFFQMIFWNQHSKCNYSVNFWAIREL